MIYTMGLDIGSTYTKGLILDEQNQIVAYEMEPTGSKLVEVANRIRDKVIEKAGLRSQDIAYIITTGYGRHLIPIRDLQVTDLTANARGALFLFPNTRTVLDIGGQTMKASRIDEKGRVVTFRLNDKCAAGTGAFLEKTARYMGYTTQDIGNLLSLAKESVPISGVCAVFAESEVISHLSEGVPPEEIMYGAILSLTDRSVQLMKRIKAEPEYTLVGGILRWKIMAKEIATRLQTKVNVPDGELAQFNAALGCALLGHLRLQKLRSKKMTQSQLLEIS